MLDSAGRPDPVATALDVAVWQVLAPVAEVDYSAYRDDPRGFILDILGDELWEKPDDPPLDLVSTQPWGAEELAEWERGSDQVRIALDVATNRFVVVRASKSVGKTWLAARLAIWFLMTRPGSIVITTANTWIQVEMQIWANIRTACANSVRPLIGDPLRTKWEPDPVRFPQWFAIGLSPLSLIHI